MARAVARVETVAQDAVVLQDAHESARGRAIGRGDLSGVDTLRDNHRILLKLHAGLGDGVEAAGQRCSRTGHDEGSRGATRYHHAADRSRRAHHDADAAHDGVDNLVGFVHTLQIALALLAGDIDLLVELLGAILRLVIAEQIVDQCGSGFLKPLLIKVVELKGGDATELSHLVLNVGIDLVDGLRERRRELFNLLAFNHLGHSDAEEGSVGDEQAAVGSDLRDVEHHLERLAEGLDSLAGDSHYRADDAHGALHAADDALRGVHGRPLAGIANLAYDAANGAFACRFEVAVIAAIVNDGVIAGKGRDAAEVRACADHLAIVMVERQGAEGGLAYDTGHVIRALDLAEVDRVVSHGDRGGAGDAAHIAGALHVALVVGSIRAALSLARKASHAVGAADFTLIIGVAEHHVVVHISVGVAALYAGRTDEAAHTGVARDGARVGAGGDGGCACAANQSACTDAGILRVGRLIGRGSLDATGVRGGGRLHRVASADQATRAGILALDGGGVAAGIERYR